MSGQSATRATIVRVTGPHLVVAPLNDELVIFDRRTSRAHLLSPTAATVWKAAGGGCTVEELSALVQGEGDSERRDVAVSAVGELQRIGLVASELKPPSRRSLLRRVGTAASLPMIMSIAAPSPAAAASNLADGAPCVIGVDTCATAGRSCVDGDGGGGEPARCCVTFMNMSQLLSGSPCTMNDSCCSSICVSSMCVGD